MQTPFCSIVILNYQGEKLIKATLQSLSALTYPREKFEVIIVDNNSHDTSKDIIDSCKEGFTKSKHQITTLYLRENLGFAGGNNEGIKASKGKYVVLLNNDCIVNPSWLSELVQVAEKDESLFAVGSKVYLQQTNKIQNAGILMFEDGYGRDIGAIVKGHSQDYAEDIGQYNREKETYAACAVAALYRKSILDQIGLLDDTFFMYYEDVELSERARINGYKIMYAPKAIVRHDHAASSGEFSNFFIYHSELGRLLHMFFWFPHRIFWREYLKFFGKSVLRIPFGIKNNRLTQQIQYMYVSLFFISHLPTLYKRKNEKYSNIQAGIVEKNYQAIRSNVRK
jgi:GT2 family glycosyltransferase